VIYTLGSGTDADRQPYSDRASLTARLHIAAANLNKGYERDSMVELSQVAQQGPRATVIGTTKYDRIYERTGPQDPTVPAFWEGASTPPFRLGRPQAFPQAVAIQHSSER